MLLYSHSILFLWFISPGRFPHIFHLHSHCQRSNHDLSSSLPPSRSPSCSLDAPDSTQCTCALSTREGLGILLSSRLENSTLLIDLVRLLKFLVNWLPLPIVLLAWWLVPSPVRFVPVLRRFSGFGFILMMIWFLVAGWRSLKLFSACRCFCRVAGYCYYASCLGHVSLEWNFGWTSAVCFQFVYWYCALSYLISRF